MTVALYIANAKVASSLVSWGVRFAHAEHTDLLVICPKRSKGKTEWEEIESLECSDSAIHKAVHGALALQDQDRITRRQDVEQGVASTDLGKVLVEVKDFCAPTPEAALPEALAGKGVSLLLVPAGELSKTDSDSDSAVKSIFNNSPCNACLIRGEAPPTGDPLRILVATHRHAEIDLELRRARQLAQTSNGQVTVLYVRPDDDEVAPRVARRNLDRIVHSIPGPYEIFDRKIKLADSMLEGIQSEDLNAYDLVMVGTRRSKTIRQVFGGLVDEPDKPFVTAVLNMRDGIPMTTQLWSRFQSWCRSKVPQLEREQRVELVDRLHNNSTFDFDFVALISLSTLIASLGLIRNSAAVVIGAMLVAPLMTPLVGVGFALIQGNVKLIRNAMRSVIYGFAVGFGISVLLGLLIPGITENGQLNSEMIGRCEPNLLDLVVALVSGIAAAYATGRPNLVGALPGVAIAAALVPPIATSGMVFSLGQFSLSWGAFLLFFTNIVAIVLGTTIAFWAIGINAVVKQSDGRPEHVWPRYWFFAFVIISFLLAAILPGQHTAVDKEKAKSKMEQVTDGSSTEGRSSGQETPE